MKIRTLFAAAFALLLAASSRATDIVAGPMLGTITDSSIRVWLQLNTSERVTVRAVEVVSGRSPGSISIDVEGPTPFVADIPTSQLDANKTYRLEVLFDDKPVDLGEPLIIRTAPNPGDPATFTVALAGGADVGADGKNPIPAAAAILELKPNLAFFLGDMGKLPAAETDFPQMRRDAFSTIATMYQNVRNNHDLRPIFRRIPSMAVWGERDFGPENSNAKFVFAREASFAFRRYWPNPMYGTPDARGVFFSTTYGDVDFFALDARMQRDPEKKQLFGKGQLDWLKAELKKSTATIKIIAAGNPLLSDDPGSWGDFKDEREAFIDFIQKEKIPGVVFVSRGPYGQLLCRKPKDDANYPLYEMVCPPLANIPAGKPTVDSNRLGAPFAANGFGTLTFGGGSKAKRFVTLQMRDEKGELKQDQTIFAANIQGR